MVAYAGLNFILVISCIFASEATARTPSSCPENRTGQLGDEVSLLQLQSDAALKRAAVSVDKYTPPPESCSPCGRCTLKNRPIISHGADTTRDWRNKCEGTTGWHGCRWTPEGTAAGKCAEIDSILSKALILDFDNTLAVSDMYDLLTKDAAYYAEAHDGAEHPYANPGNDYKVFAETDEYLEKQHELDEDCDREAKLPAEHQSKKKNARGIESKHGFTDKQRKLMAERQQIKEENRMAPDDMLENQRNHGYLPDDHVKNAIWGGQERINALASVLHEAQTNGWQLWILSFGVEAEIKTALEIAGLYRFFAPIGDRNFIVGKSVTRNRLNRWPGDGEKCTYIHEIIRTDAPVLMDDNQANVDACHDTGFCGGMKINPETGLNPITLEILVKLPPDSDEFGHVLGPKHMVG